MVWWWWWGALTGSSYTLGLVCSHGAQLDCLFFSVPIWKKLPGVRTPRLCRDPPPPLPRSYSSDAALLCCLAARRALNQDEWHPGGHLPCNQPQRSSHLRLQGGAACVLQGSTRPRHAQQVWPLCHADGADQWTVDRGEPPPTQHNTQEKIVSHNVNLLQ